MNVYNRILLRHVIKCNGSGNINASIRETLCNGDKENNVDLAIYYMV